jgi:S-adenosylmethionine hydrolase
MNDPLITLTTDFGEGSHYVAAVKGVILGVNPAVRIVDLSHSIPPQDIRSAAFFLANSVPYFSTGTTHVVVVDPGVGSSRALLYVDTKGHRLLVPDNGCWTLLPAPSMVRRLEEARYWRPTVSPTFHGRDILAPVAGWLSRGLDPAALGPVVTEWVRLKLPAPRREADRVTGEVVYVDSFGNLITNIPGDWLANFGNARSPKVSVGGVAVTRRVATYAEADPGTTVALISSSGMLEIAIAQGSAAVQLKAGRSSLVSVVLTD